MRVWSGKIARRDGHRRHWAWHWPWEESQSCREVQVHRWLMILLRFSTAISACFILMFITLPPAIPTPNKLLPLFVPHLHPGLICLASIPNLPVLPLLFLVPGHKPTGLGVKPGARELFNGIYALATGDSCRRRTATLGTQWISMSYSSNDICMQSAIYWIKS